MENRMAEPTSRQQSVAEAWLREAGQGSLDGVIAKRLDVPYEPGERAMVKVKPHRTADCVVGGFRYQSGSAFVGSLCWAFTTPRVASIMSGSPRRSRTDSGLL
jgi:ATP-dependent DNA ligase